MKRPAGLLVLVLVASGLVAAPSATAGPPTSVRPPEPPQVLRVGPAAGPVAGGSTVTVRGRNFVDVERVTFAGTRATNVRVLNRRTLTATAPARTAGPARIRVVAAGGKSRATAEATYRYTVAPRLAALSATAGPTTGGEQLTLTGRGLRFTSAVLFGEVAADGLEVVDQRTVRVVVPAHAAATVDVVLRTPGGTATLPGAYRYVDAPVVEALSPSSGPTAGGTAVVVSGTGFVPGATTVVIGDTTVPAAQVDVTSSTSLTFTTPARDAGVVDVRVTTPGGGAAAPGGFTYTAPAPVVRPPRVTAAAPSAGPAAGGTTVTVTGARFVPGGTQVTLGGVPVAAGSVTVNGSTSLTFVTPARPAGSADLEITTPDGTGRLAGAFTYLDAPSLSSLTPAVGPPAGGTDVTVTGTGFVDGATTVTVDGTDLPAPSVRVSGPTSLTFTTPAHSAGAVDVTVATDGGTDTLTNGYTYVAAPTLSTISPAQGPLAGGTAVTLTGTGFVAGSTSVEIGGTTVPAGSVTVNSTSSLTFTTPARAAGNVPVRAETPGGTTAAVPGGFTYVAAPTIGALTPQAGPLAGGTTVTLSGTGFVAGSTSVAIGGTTIPAGSVTVNSASSLTFITPAHAAGAVDLAVSSPGGTDVSANAFTYVGPASVVFVSPDRGAVAGGTTVTIAGTGFVPGATTVTLGSTTVPAGQVTVSGTTLTFDAPAHPAGIVDVTVTTPGGTAVVPDAFTYVVAPVLTSLTPDRGSSAGGSTVVLNGSNLATTSGVTFGGVPVPFIVFDDTLVLVTSVPPGSPGTVDVAVTTSGGTATLANAFTYVGVP